MHDETVTLTLPGFSDAEELIDSLERLQHYIFNHSHETVVFRLPTLLDVLVRGHDGATGTFDVTAFDQEYNQDFMVRSAVSGAVSVHAHDGTEDHEHGAEDHIHSSQAFPYDHAHGGFGQHTHTADDHLHGAHFHFNGARVARFTDTTTDNQMVEGEDGVGDVNDACFCDDALIFHVSNNRSFRIISPYKDCASADGNEACFEAADDGANAPYLGSAQGWSPSISEDVLTVRVAAPVPSSGVRVRSNAGPLIVEVGSAVVFAGTPAEDVMFSPRDVNVVRVRLMPNATHARRLSALSIFVGIVPLQPYELLEPPESDCDLTFSDSVGSLKSIALSGDGTRLVVGIPSQSDVRVFDYVAPNAGGCSSSEWTKRSQLTRAGTGIGKAVAINHEGDVVLAAANDRVYRFDRSGVSWSQTSTTPVSPHENFGMDLCMSDDGDEFILQSESKYTSYVLSNGVWSACDITIGTRTHNSLSCTSDLSRFVTKGKVWKKTGGGSACGYEEDIFVPALSRRLSVEPPHRTLLFHTMNDTHGRALGHQSGNYDLRQPDKPNDWSGGGVAIGEYFFQPHRTLLFHTMNDTHGRALGHQSGNYDLRQPDKPNDWSGGV